MQSEGSYQSRYVKARFVTWVQQIHSGSQEVRSPLIHLAGMEFHHVQIPAAPLWNVRTCRMKSKNSTIPNVGDWICAYNNGLIAIAQVMYVAKSTDYGHEAEPLFVTDHGAVLMDDILEVRRPM